MSYAKELLAERQYAHLMSLTPFEQIADEYGVSAKLIEHVEPEFQPEISEENGFVGNVLIDWPRITNDEIAELHEEFGDSMENIKSIPWGMTDYGDGIDFSDFISAYFGWDDDYLQEQFEQLEENYQKTVDELEELLSVGDFSNLRKATLLSAFSIAESYTANKILNRLQIEMVGASLSERRAIREALEVNEDFMGLSKSRKILWQFAFPKLRSKSNFNKYQIKDEYSKIRNSLAHRYIDTQIESETFKESIEYLENYISLVHSL